MGKRFYDGTYKDEKRLLLCDLIKNAIRGIARKLFFGHAQEQLQSCP